MNKPINSINCLVTMSVEFHGKKIFYNGTTLDLVNQLLKAGGQAGDTFRDDSGEIEK